MRPLLRAGALAIAVCALSGCRNYNLFDAKGPVGAAEANILIIASVIMLAIIVPTMIATIVLRALPEGPGPQRSPRRVRVDCTDMRQDQTRRGPSGIPGSLRDPE